VSVNQDVSIYAAHAAQRARHLPTPSAPRRVAGSRCSAILPFSTRHMSNQVVV